MDVINEEYEWNIIHYMYIIHVHLSPHECYVDEDIGKACQGLSYEVYHLVKYNFRGVSLRWNFCG